MPPDNPPRTEKAPAPVSLVPIPAHQPLPAPLMPMDLATMPLASDRAMVNPKTGAMITDRPAR